MYVRKQPWCVKNIALTFTKEFIEGSMREKINSFTFYPEKSAHLQLQNKKLPHFLCRFIKASMREKIYLLTFSADLQALCTPATKLFLNTSSLIQRNKIKDLSEYAFNFLHFSYKWTKNPLTYTKDFRGTLSTKISHLLQIVYKRRKNTSHFLCRF